MTPLAEPKLAAPGAGLPKIELLVARVIFAMQRLTGNREAFDARFRKERDLIRALVASCDAESAACRVLIKRLPGLEDSSRYWSIWMTLDHLRIVNQVFARIIDALTKGILPEEVASTAGVKPATELNADVLTAYEESCEALLAGVAACSDLNTTLRYAHPWFGPLTASGWHALTGVHMGIHRVQIERILAGLSAVRK